MRYVLCLAASALLCGCVSSGTQVKDSALAQFQKGTTTEAQVIQALGPPQGSSNSMSGLRTISYVGMHAQPTAASFIPIVGIFAGGADTHTSVVTFRFGADGKLADMTSQQSDASARVGVMGSQAAAPAPAVVR